METQDHINATKSGHGGTHLCRKCGWPYPNQHPSARHRRAHRKVCGTVQGYNTQDERTHGDVEQCVSDNDEQETSSEKGVARSISRRSKSGKSTRSEDDVYTDAVMDFVGGPCLEDASDGVVFRQKPLEKITEIDTASTQVAIENAITDNSFAPDNHVDNNQLQTVQKFESEIDKTKGGMLPQDTISCSTAVSVSATVNESAVEHIMQGSRTSSELNPNLDVGEVQETSTIDSSELITPAIAANTSEGVSPLRDVLDELLDSVSGDKTANPTEIQTDAFEGKVEYSPLNDSAQVVDGVNGDIGKYTCMIEDPYSKVSNEDMGVVGIQDAVPIKEHPEIIVGNLDYNKDKFNMPTTPNSTLAFESITNIKEDLALEESCYGTELAIANTGESGDVSSQDDDVLEQNGVGDANQLSDPKASCTKVCDTDTGEFKGLVLKESESETLKKETNSSEEEQKRSVPLDDVSPEAIGVTLDGVDDKGDVSEGENLIVLEIDSTPAEADETLVESALLKDIINAHGDGQDIRENESTAGTTETESCYETKLLGFHEEKVEASEIENYESRKIEDSSDVMVVGLSQPESLRASEGVVDSSSQIDSPDANWGSVSEALSETKASLGRKKEVSNIRSKKQQIISVANKEIIAKWGSEKKRTSLKALLGEDTHRSWAKSPSQDEFDSIPDEQVAENELYVKKAKDNRNGKGDEVYPVNIKTEKRRNKYWATFLCCYSQVNAASAR